MEDFTSMGLNARTCPIEIPLPVPCAWVINCIRISRVLQRHQHPTDFGPPSAVMFPFFCTFVARYVIVASRSFFFCPQHRYHQWHIYPSWVSSYFEQSGSDACCQEGFQGNGEIPMHPLGHEVWEAGGVAVSITGPCPILAYTCSSLLTWNV